MDGGITVETDMTDIGIGVYTIAQTAAEMMAARSGDKFALSTRLYQFPQAPVVSGNLTASVVKFARDDRAEAPAGVMARVVPTADSRREDWDRVIGINLRGVWSCMKHELRQMAQQGSGAIVNNASVGARTGNPGIGSYFASKHGVVGLTRTAALEYIR